MRADKNGYAAAVERQKWAHQPERSVGHSPTPETGKRAAAGASAERPRRSREARRRRGDAGPTAIPRPETGQPQERQHSDGEAVARDRLPPARGTL